MTDNAKRTQQKEQSRRWIAEALLQILEEKPYQEITISEVAARADLSRRTFYRHFETLDDVVDYEIQTLCDEFIAGFEIETHRKGDLIQATEQFFRFWADKRSVLRLLSGSNRVAFPQQMFLDTVYEKRLIQMETTPPKESHYMYRFAIGGLWNMLLQWAADDDPPTPTEMGQIVQRVLLLATEA